MAKPKYLLILKLAISSIFLYTSYTLQAQKIYINDGVVFEQYNHDYNLSHNYIHNFLKDSKGFIWLGTPEGVNVLDGESVKIFKGYLNKNNNFRGKDVLSLFEDSNGNIFCGTKAYGLNIYNRASTSFININESLLSNAVSKSIKSIVQIDKLNYALLTEKEIIYFTLDSSYNVSSTFHLEISLNDKEFTRELLVYENQLYLVSNKRLVKITKDKQELIFSHKWLNQCKVKNNKIWLIADKRVGQFSKDLKQVNWLNYTLKENKKGENDFFISLDISVNNEVWIGTKYQLIRLTLNKHLDIINSKEIENKVPIKNLLVDSTNNVFMATRGALGLVKMDGRQNQYDYIKLPKGNEDVYRHNFNEDGDGNIWIGGNPGVFAYNTKTKSYHKFKNGTYKGLPNRKINQQFKDRSGKIWFVTSNGIATYNPSSENFDIYGQDVGGFWDSFTIYLNEDSSNNLWYKTKNRINKINNSDKSHEFFEIKGVEVIFIDEKDILWMIIKDVGLVKYSIKSGSPTVIKNYFTYDEILNFGVQQILDDKYGRLWITSRNGIYIYNPTEEKFIFHLNRNNLLKFDFLYGIVEDNQGNFWVSQFRYPAICISPDTFKVIDRSPFWMRREAKTEEYAGIANIDENGNVFTEGIGGFFMYQSDSLKINPRPPNFVLEQVKINGETQFDNFLGAEKLVYNDLEFDNNNVDILLKEVNPQTSYSTQYAYRLLGSSGEWQFTKKLGSLNYSALSPNNYQLQVKSTNNGDVWSAPLTLATFSILPPWWQSTYAYLVYTLFAGLLIYVLYKFQLTKKLAENETLKLKEVDDFKNEFYQNITHEFRTPLTVILGATDEKNDKSSITIKRNAEQLLGLVNELLDVGHIEFSSSQVDIKTQDVVSFSKYCMESLQSLADQKNIQMDFVANKEKILMNFDTNKYQLILNNLLSNALKFTPEAGNVSLEVNELKTSIVISIIDNGIGIPEHDLEKVFERYYQSENNENSIGSGIGLALTKELVKLMDGSITVSNNPDEGACFKMIFPQPDGYSLSTNEPFEDNTSPTFAEDNENVVLIIEDNKDVMEYITSILPKKYTLLTAENGKLGVEKAIEVIPDIIISDVMMPFMNGYEVCKRLKTEERTNHIPIVLLTAKADIKSKIEGINIGADAYLSKPFNKTELIAQLDNLIQTREKLKTKYASEITSNSVKETQITDEFLSKIYDLLLSKIDNEDYGIDELCKDLAISRTQLHRKIKALTGLSTSIFIRQIRLNEAYKLLYNKDLTIAEIAYRTGFSDPNYFTKLFSEKYNSSPTNLRKQI